jgi:heat-inducible transcriptional repressor
MQSPSDKDIPPFLANRGIRAESPKQRDEHREQTISKREYAILRQLIQLYSKTGEPVSSELIHKTRTLSCSPATIRGILAELERRGLLKQPHTSAGRLPTDLGYRAFVDAEMLKIDPLSSLEARSLEAELLKCADQEQFLRQASSFLQRRTGLPTFCWFYPHCCSRVEHAYLHQTRGDSLLGHFILSSGSAVHIELHLQMPERTPALLARLNQAMREECVGHFLGEVRFLLQRKMARDLFQLDLAMKHILSCFTFIETSAKQPRLLEFNGLRNLVRLQPKEEPEIFEGLLSLLEPPHKWLKQLSEQAQRGLTTLIGMESGRVDLANFSMVASDVPTRQPFGGVGIIGPKRMPYSLSFQWLAQVDKAAAAYAER